MNNALQKLILKTTIYIYKDLTLAYVLKNHFLVMRNFELFKVL